MKKLSYSFFGRKTMRTIAIVAGSMTVAFIIGVETAGEVKPVVSSTNAGGTVIAGDMNGNGHVDAEDAEIALDISMGVRVPSPAELEADPNQDFHITKEDVAAILDILQRNDTK